MTKTRSELSKRNPFWIERHRYYELKHFCLQYPIWIKARDSVSGLATSILGGIKIPGYSSETVVERAARQREYYNERIGIVGRCAKLADKEISEALIYGITNDISYDILRVQKRLNCSRKQYYEAYRKFFWILNKEHY